MNELSERYLEDFAVGQTFGSGRLRIDGQRALAFAAEFDPQPFHLDEAAARRSIFGGLTASGWHTAAVTMRLLVETELKPAGGIIGAGLDECRWPRPVRPGDELRVECEVIEVRPSKSRPAQGLIRLRTATLNQNNEAVLMYVANTVVQSRRQTPPKEKHRDAPASASWPLRIVWATSFAVLTRHRTACRGSATRMARVRPFPHPNPSRPTPASRPI
jgi:acyl dehydratase